jgi:hypothetical protein
MSADPILVRALVACYPRRWRERYADEYAALLSDTIVPAGWHRRPALVRNALLGAWDAHIHGYGGASMSRSPLSTAVWATGLFTVAGIGFQKLTEFTAAGPLAHRHPAITAAFVAMVVASAVTIAAIVLTAIPAAVAMARGRTASDAATADGTGYGRAWRLVAVPVVAFAAWYGILLLGGRIARGHTVHSAANITAALIVIATGVGVVALTAWAASGVLRRVDEPGPAPLRPIALTVLAVGMAATTVAALAWGLAVRAADPAGFASHDGLLASPFVPSWIGILVLMAAASLWAASASRRVRRPEATA